MLEYHPTRIFKMSIFHSRAATTLLPPFWSTHGMLLQMIVSLDFQVRIHTKVKIISTWIMEKIVRFELVMGLQEGGAMK